MTRQSNVQRSDQTHAALLTAARHEFTERGYAAAGTDAIVQRAQVTRGALYYHFKDKRDLFRAVFTVIEEEILAKIEERAAGAPGVFDGLIAGCEAFLDSCLDRDVRQIALVDAPSVLGWAQWREIDARYGMRSLRQGLEACVQSGALRPLPIDPMTHLLSGAMNEAALLIAESAEPVAARAEMGRSLTELILGLRA